MATKKGRRSTGFPQKLDDLLIRKTLLHAISLARNYLRAYYVIDYKKLLKSEIYIEGNHSGQCRNIFLCFCRFNSISLHSLSETERYSSNLSRYILYTYALRFSSYFTLTTRPVNSSCNLPPSFLLPCSLAPNSLYSHSFELADSKYWKQFGFKKYPPCCNVYE